MFYLPISKPLSGIIIERYLEKACPSIEMYLFSHICKLNILPVVYMTEVMVLRNYFVAWNYASSKVVIKI